MKRTILLNTLLPFGILALIFSVSLPQQVTQARPEISKPSTNIVLAHGRLQWGAQLDNKYYLPDGSREHYLHIQVKGGELPENNSQRAPLNISIVLDRSGSMSGDKIKYAREAAHYIIDRLQFGDYLSIVCYDDEVNILSYAQPVRNKERLHQAVNEIAEGGSTNLMGGTLEGYNQLGKLNKPAYINRVLLLTDGLANVGITDHTQIKRMVSEKFISQGFALSTFGIGAQYNEDLLTMMAETGRGNYYFIEHPNRIAGIFANELKGLLNVVAKNVLLKVMLPTGMSCVQGYGALIEQGRGMVSINLNDVYAHEEKVVLLKLISNTSYQAGNITATLSFKDVPTHQLYKSSVSLTLQPTKDFELFSRSENALVENQVVLYKEAENMDAILSDVDEGNYQEARTKATKSLKILKERQAIAPSAELKKQEAQLSRYADEMDQVESMSREEKSIYQKNNKAANYNLKRKK